MGVSRGTVNIRRCLRSKLYTQIITKIDKIDIDFSLLYCSPRDVPDVMLSRLQKTMFSSTNRLCHASAHTPAMPQFYWPYRPASETHGHAPSCQTCLVEKEPLNSHPPESCTACPSYAEPLDTMCPLVDVALWSTVFLQRTQLDGVRRSVAWTLGCIGLLGVIGGLFLSG